MELVGQGVQLQGEDMTLGPDGKLLAAGRKPNKASELFTTAFTKKYAEISAARAGLRPAPQHDRPGRRGRLHSRSGLLRTGRLAARRPGRRGQAPVETLATPKQVQCVVNALWKENRLLVPAVVR